MFCQLITGQIIFVFIIMKNLRTPPIVYVSYLFKPLTLQSQMTVGGPIRTEKPFLRQQFTHLA
jgi:hypothetical protein